MREIRDRFLKDLIRLAVGPQISWRASAHARLESRDFPARMQDVVDRLSVDARAYAPSPIFVLSAGWRSGSTMLQRMIMVNNPDLLIWGEPFDLANVHDNMANQFRAFTQDWPPESYFLAMPDGTNLSDSWVANLYPDMQQLLAAHRHFYDTLFAATATRAGRSRWGLKEVRLTIDNARYFRALYPQCKILLLYRNPFDAYRSYRRWRMGVFRRWPDRFVATPRAFGRNWAELTRGFLDGHRTVDALLIRYEDLDDAPQIDRLSEYLGWTVPRSSQVRRIRDRTTDQGPASPREDRLPVADRLLIELTTRRVRRDAGYGSTRPTAAA